MNPSKPWEYSPRCDMDDVNSLHEEINRMRRALCTVTRAYNQTKKELEDMKEATGFYDKPFPFLQLPREVRDQIYDYAFIASASIITEPRPIDQLSLHPLASKPPTPGLYFVNKQIHSEGIEILYGKNTFSFRFAGDLIRFEEENGPDRQNLVRSLDISTVFVLPNSTVPDPLLAGPQDWKFHPTHWAKTLLRSGLSGVVEMRIIMINPQIARGRPVTIIPVLQQAVEKMLQRNPDAGLKRRLKLIGFSETEKDKFPNDWEVQVGPWDRSLINDADCFPSFD